MTAGDIALGAIKIYFCIAVLGIVFFDRDYGRGVCWQRTVGEHAHMMIVIPAMAIVLTIYVIWKGVVWLFTECGRSEAK